MLSDKFKNEYFKFNAKYLELVDQYSRLFYVNNKAGKIEASNWLKLAYHYCREEEFSFCRVKGGKDHERLDKKLSVEEVEWKKCLFEYFTYTRDRVLRELFKKYYQYTIYEELLKWDSSNSSELDYWTKGIINML